MEWIGDLERAFAGLIYPNRIVFAVVAVGIVVALLAVGRRRRWYEVARRHPRGTAAIVIPALAIALPLGWYLASPLVLSKTIDEPAPIVVGAASATPAASSPSPTASASATPTPRATPSPSPSAPPVARSGSFHGADDFHFGRGTAHLLETEPGVFVVRLADFEVRNGPDLYVYLSPSADGYAKPSVELGPLKADKGNQNYAIPPGVDPTAARSVVIWCKQFSVLFATAPFDS
jgi:electron transfer DM13